MPEPYGHDLARAHVRNAFRELAEARRYFTEMELQSFIRQHHVNGMGEPLDGLGGRGFVRSIGEAIMRGTEK